MEDDVLIYMLRIVHQLSRKFGTLHIPIQCAVNGERQWNYMVHIGVL